VYESSPNGGGGARPRRERRPSVDARLGIKHGGEPRERCGRAAGATEAVLCHRCAFGIGYNVCVCCDTWLGHREDGAPAGPGARECAECADRFGNHCAKCGTIVTLPPRQGLLCTECAEIGTEVCAYMRKPL
jgi:hypothetical protein